MRSIRGTLLMLGLLLATSAGAGENGTLLVVNKSGDSVSLIDLEQGKRVAEIPTAPGPHEIAVSSDGRTAVVSHYGDAHNEGSSLGVIDVEKAQEIRRIDITPWHRPHGLAWFPDNRRIAVTVESNRALLIVDVSSGKIEQEIASDADLSHMVTVDARARRAYVTNIGSGSLSVLDLEKGRLIATVRTGRGAEGLALSADGESIWVSNREDDTVSIVATDTLQTRMQIKAGDYPIRVAFADKHHLALVVAAESGTLELFDTQTWQHRATIPVAGGLDLDRGSWFSGWMGLRPFPIGVLVHPDGDRAYVANTLAGHIAVVDLIERRIIARLLAGSEPDGLGYSPLKVVH